MNMNAEILFILWVITVSVPVSVHDGLVVEEEELQGYYWRDYIGTIPKDAIPAGNSTTGESTYIGQVLYKEQLIPAKIETNPERITFEWGYQEYVAKENIKILCTHYKHHFEWFPTNFTNFEDDIKDQHVIPGGYEINTKLYIGRTEFEGELAVGKVIKSLTQTTLNTTKNGKGYQHSSFSVLVYNPKKGSSGIFTRFG